MKNVKEQKKIPYKIYLEESEMPRYWYNLRADMINKPAPLLSPETHKPMTEKDLSGVHIEEDTKRYYPYANLFSSMVGFTSYDNEGEYGLEYKFDEVLSGVAGRRVL